MNLAKGKLMKNMVVLIGALIIFSMVAILAGCGAARGSANVAASESSDNDSSGLSVSILKVGKADAIICEIDGHALVIDAGEDDDGDEVIEFLENHAISRLDALIITHYDKDHVGGADQLIGKIPVDSVFLPDYVGTHSEYEEFMLALEDEKITPTMVSSPQTLTIGGANITIDPPTSYEIPDDEDEYDNDFSLLTTIVYGEKTLLFTGDIEEARIAELVNAGQLFPVDFLKVPHHGKFNEGLDDLFRITSPAYAVICSSDKNPADKKTLRLLEKYSINYAETRNGDVTITSDGHTIEMKQD